MFECVCVKLSLGSQSLWHQDFACEHLCIAGQFAGVDGRMDHTLGAMNALYKAQAKGLNAALLSGDTQKKFRQSALEAEGQVY